MKNRSWIIILIGSALTIYGFILFVLPIFIFLLYLVKPVISKDPRGTIFPAGMSITIKSSYIISVLIQRIFVPACSFIFGIAFLMSKHWVRKSTIIVFGLNIIARLITLFLLINNPGLMKMFRSGNGHIWLYSLWFLFDIAIIVCLSLPEIKKRLI